MQNLSAVRGVLLASTFLSLAGIAAARNPVVITQEGAMHGAVSGACDAPGFPITICESGSYIFESNLTVPENTDGIDIAVPDVSIDLNGFTIKGPVTCTGVGATLSCSHSEKGGNGISTVSQFVTGNTTVRNGTVRGFGQLGINLTASGNIVDGINADENRAAGIFVWYGTVSNSTSSRNGGGFVCFAGQLKHNTAYGNVVDGISLNRCSATDNATNFNGQYGLSGFHSIVSGNESDSNGAGDLFNEVGLVSVGNNSCSGAGC
jgi:hypothetical protein